MKIYNSILDAIFPFFCVGCKARGEIICTNCVDDLWIVDHQICIACSKPSLQGLTHPKCQTKYSPAKTISFFNYHDQKVKKLITMAKSSFISEPFVKLTKLVCQKMNLINLSQSITITPIPTTHFKYNFQGFNPAEIIGQNLAHEFGLHYVNLLEKNRWVKQQKQLSKAKRILNVRKAFSPARETPMPINVLLVDDVITTGSTLKEASKVLKKAGVKNVTCFSLTKD